MHWLRSSRIEKDANILPEKHAKWVVLDAHKRETYSWDGVHGCRGGPTRSERTPRAASYHREKRIINECCCIVDSQGEIVDLGGSTTAGRCKDWSAGGNVEVRQVAVERVKAYE